MSHLLDDSGNILTDDSGNELDDGGGGGGGGSPVGNGMTIPSVSLQELDGAIGVLPTGQKIYAITGTASGGPLNTPAAFSRKQDVISNFVDGPLVEEACFYIETYRQPVLLSRTGNTVPGSCDAINVSGVLGSSVITNTVTTSSDDRDYQFLVVAGGTIGVAGITYKLSYDGGATFGALQALGTANTLVLPNSGGVTIAFAAGTLLAGALATLRGKAPNWNASELGASLTALDNTSQSWDLCCIVGTIDATAFDAIEVAFAGMKKKAAWVGSARMPNAAESEAAYKTALDTIFSAKASTRGMLCAGAARTISGVNFTQPRVPARRCIGARAGFSSSEIDLADINLGTLAGVDIRDLNGNAIEHDEAINPGLDDSRYATLRTWDLVQGVYVTNPRLFSPNGSDFEFLQHRRVMNECEQTLLVYFIRRLSKPVVVNRKTGFILEGEALEIESGANALLRSVLQAKPKVSDVGVTLSRTDNLLSTKTLTGQCFLVPLAYPKLINLSVGFRNPALQILKQ